jgi:hypothetical protein
MPICTASLYSFFIRRNEAEAEDETVVAVVVCVLVGFELGLFDRLVVFVVVDDDDEFLELFGRLVTYG